MHEGVKGKTPWCDWTLQTWRGKNSEFAWRHKLSGWMATWNSTAAPISPAAIARVTRTVRQPKGPDQRDETRRLRQESSRPHARAVSIGSDGGFRGSQLSRAAEVNVTTALYYGPLP
jgi:hypothetical protein